MTLNVQRFELALDLSTTRLILLSKVCGRITLKCSRSTWVVASLTGWRALSEMCHLAAMIQGWEDSRQIELQGHQRYYRLYSKIDAGSLDCTESCKTMRTESLCLAVTVNSQLSSSISTKTISNYTFVKTWRLMKTLTKTKTPMRALLVFGLAQDPSAPLPTVRQM